MSVRFKSALLQVCTARNIPLDDHNLSKQINLTKQIIAVRPGSG